MTLKDLFDLSVQQIVARMQNSFGLVKFAQRRAKFEGWLKVELVDILAQQGYNALPEIERVDVSFDTVGIELKTVNTNIRYSNVINLTRPITNNIAGLLKDIERLKIKAFNDKFVVFVVFPITHENIYWKVHFGQVICKLDDCLYQEFMFGENIPGVIYYGQVK